ncbi:hypothetical protein AKJ36_02630 [candidate division MSBL1 archaeon SCGC-AAA259I07]|uniref:Uncharacterized protein n=1 Tax=candidate division MSBL1 archaeon SCGC-AAA259I07 TaxID=1698266 RepID=A0A133UK56_9EURY|nr:hypothetical protein AKJ36_02630 [candidate division MSBL1 archaeon SCGC-AAA259I07]
MGRVLSARSVGGLTGNQKAQGEKYEEDPVQKRRPGEVLSQFGVLQILVYFLFTSALGHSETR